jgi:hypothetical protein
MFGDRRVHDFPAIVAEDDRNVEQPKRRAGYDRHIHGSDTLSLFAQKAALARRRPTSSLHHILSNGSLADLDAELEKCTVDPRRAPERVGAAHLPNQITNLAIH